MIEHEQVIAWLEASCAAQGVPVKITDSRVVAQIALLLNAGNTPRD